MSYSGFRNDAITKRDIITTGNLTGEYIFGNLFYATGGGQASIPNQVYADIFGNVDATGNIATTGNVSASYFIGNGAFLTGIVGGGGALPNNANIDIRGNVVGNTITANTMTAITYFGDGSKLSNVLTVATKEITADLFGNVWTAGTIQTTGALTAGTISGDCSGITNVPLSALQPGDIYRNVFGNIIGNNVTMTGNVTCTTVVSSNISSGNITGIFQLAYSNLTTAPFNFQAQSGANLFVRSGTATMALMRTDGIALTSNGTSLRFGTTDFDKGVLTNSTDGQYAAGTLTGDLVIHNTKPSGRTAIASSFGVPEITVWGGNVGVKNVSPAFPLDVNGNVNATTFLGNVSGAFANIIDIVVGNVITGNIVSGNINGVLNVAYPNLVQTSFNFHAGSAANLFVRSGTSVMAAIRTDGIALTSNGTAVRFGLNDNDKGMMTNSTDNQYAVGTLAGDLVIHNTKPSGRTAIASSYGTPEITVWSGNVGIRNTSPAFPLDVIGQVNATTTGVASSSVLINATNAGYTGTVLRTVATNSGTGFNHITSTSAGGNVFRVRGDGQAFGVVFNTSGADYAEYFEWEDTNPAKEDRRGKTVVLVGEKIRLSTQGDNPYDVFGIVSAVPSVVGDAQWSHWGGKYLKDEFGARVSNVVYFTSDGDISTRCGPDDVPENGNVIITQAEWVLNPKYDPEKPYVPRELRPEWGCIGLVGKLRVLPDQVVNPSWRLMSAANDVNEYLIAPGCSTEMALLKTEVELLKAEVMAMKG